MSFWSALFRALDSSCTQVQSVDRNITSMLTSSVEQSPSLKADSRSAGYETFHILWNQKLYCCMNKSSPPDPILSQFNPFHTTRFSSVNVGIIWLRARAEFWGFLIGPRTPSCLSLAQRTVVMPVVHFPSCIVCYALQCVFTDPMLPLYDANCLQTKLTTASAWRAVVS